MVAKVGLGEVSSWLGCAWVNCGGFLIRFLGYPFISRAWAILSSSSSMAEGEDGRLWARWFKVLITASLCAMG